ncbi:DUF2138 family protein [Escherichia coli]
MALPNRRNCRETVYAKYWCARKQSARRCLPISQTQQGEAQIWRREVSSNRSSPKAQAAQPNGLMPDYPACSLAMQNKTLLSPR